MRSQRCPAEPIFLSVVKQNEAKGIDMLRDDASMRGMNAGRIRSRRNFPPLPPTVLDQLGQELRAVYYQRSEQPQYVGDPALPLEFDPYLYRLYQKERASRLERAEQVGLSSVASALNSLTIL